MPERPRARDAGDNDHNNNNAARRRPARAGLQMALVVTLRNVTPMQVGHGDVHSGGLDGGLAARGEEFPGRGRRFRRRGEEEEEEGV